MRLIFQRRPERLRAHIFLCLLAYYFESEMRRAMQERRFAAVYGIAGMVAIPLNYFAIELFGGAAMHPDNLERDSLGAGMGWPFALGVITALVALVHLVRLRFDLEERRIEASRLEAELDQREA